MSKIKTFKELKVGDKLYTGYGDGYRNFLTEYEFLGIDTTTTSYYDGTTDVNKSYVVKRNGKNICHRYRDGLLSDQRFFTTLKEVKDFIEKEIRERITKAEKALKDYKSDLEKICQN